jgi:hypothetical protein
VLVTDVAPVPLFAALMPLMLPVTLAVLMVTPVVAGPL